MAGSGSYHQGCFAPVTWGVDIGPPLKEEFDRFTATAVSGVMERRPILFVSYVDVQAWDIEFSQDIGLPGSGRLHQGSGAIEALGVDIGTFIKKDVDDQNIPFGRSTMKRPYTTDTSGFEHLGIQMDEEVNGAALTRLDRREELRNCRRCNRCGEKQDRCEYEYYCCFRNGITYLFLFKARSVVKLLTSPHHRRFLPLFHLNYTSNFPGEQIILTMKDECISAKVKECNIAGDCCTSAPPGMRVHSCTYVLSLNPYPYYHSYYLLFLLLEFPQCEVFFPFSAQITGLCGLETGTILAYITCYHHT